MIERPNTVSGLMAKRRELRLQIKRLVKHVRAIDGAIQVFEESDKRKTGRKAYGERHRYVLEYLRKATGPVTVSEVTASWNGHKGLILDANQKNEIRRRIRVTFGKLKNAGMIEEIGEATGWKWGDYVPNKLIKNIRSSPIAHPDVDIPTEWVSDINLTDEIIIGIIKGERGIYLKCIVKFSDVFSKMRVSSLAVELTTKADYMAKRLIVSNNGNDAD